VDADDLPELRRFTTGLRRDYEAMLAGPSLEHRAGRGHRQQDHDAERQMFGRANFDLLRKRVLLTH
jgi:transposase